MKFNEETEEYEKSDFERFVDEILKRAKKREQNDYDRLEEWINDTVKNANDGERLAEFILEIMKKASRHGKKWIIEQINEEWTKPGREGEAQ